MISGSKTISICGGLLNAAALEVSKDFDTLYVASLELARIFCRVLKLAYTRSRATEFADGCWGCAVTGISADKLQIALEKFQHSMVRPPRPTPLLCLALNGDSVR